MRQIKIIIITILLSGFFVFAEGSIWAQSRPAKFSIKELVPRFSRVLKNGSQTTSKNYGRGLGLFVFQKSGLTAAPGHILGHYCSSKATEQLASDLNGRRFYGLGEKSLGKLTKPVAKNLPSFLNKHLPDSPSAKENGLGNKGDRD